jgi:hypothetical protein
VVATRKCGRDGTAKTARPLMYRQKVKATTPQ